jgi:hypothetical protein
LERIAAMQLRRVTAIVVGIALAGGLTGAALVAAQSRQTQEGIWQDEPRDQRRPWWERELTEDVIKRIMQGLEQRDPAKAKELARLKEKDPEKFKAGVIEHGQPEIDQITRERWQVRFQRRNTEFLEWLKANYPREEQHLGTLRNGDPQIYLKHFDHMMNQYGYIFDARSNPELMAVLKEDLELRKRTDELHRRLRAEKSDARRQAIGLELQEVVGRRYDLIVRRKEIAYEELLKRLDELQKQVTESRSEIVKYKNEQVKRENVRQRLQTLTDNKVRFKWD